MKTLPKYWISVMAVSGALLFTGNQSAHAFTVYDPTVHAQMIISTAQEIAKFAEMVNNQVKEIRKLEEQVSTLRHYVTLFGDPGAQKLPSLGLIKNDLNLPEVGVHLGDLVKRADAVKAMVNDGGGVFAAIGQEFTTPGGSKVRRDGRFYRPVAVMQEATANYLAVLRQSSERRALLKAEIAKTTEALNEAKDDAQVQKLTGTLVTLGSALQETGDLVEQATASAIVQDIATRTDEKRQEAARAEESSAEFHEAMHAFGRTFRVMSTPTAFPTR
ncbi:MAG: hypothetical protein JNK85_26240 [Verrucomicrobiales bacterium]|nr:hypothetical protein [Verrucomicrobiales bacterium]